MPRILLGGALIALVALVYALFDLSFTDRSRIRRLNRPLWYVIVIALPVVGPLLWVLWGKKPRGGAPAPAGDDSARFGSGKPAISTEETDRRIREIEEQLEALEVEEAEERERLRAQRDVQPDEAADAGSGAEDTPAGGASDEEPRQDEPADEHESDDADDDDDASGAQTRDRGNGGQLGA